ncbi:RNase H domain-containing protein [Trichonephila clavipes]|nr:RNase H domain-containing protein [Trichonephila clavipes]
MSWSSHQRLKRGSPFGHVVSGHLVASSVEHHCLSQITDPSEGLDGVYFHVDLFIQIHFQWIPHHVNIDGNDIADSLARAGAGETTTPAAPLTYLELFFKFKAKNKTIWMIPPVHPWYQSKGPGGSLVRGSSRRDQTTLTRFLSGHLMSLTFVDGIKHFEVCTKCSSAQASHGHMDRGSRVAGLGSRSPIGFGLLQSEWTQGPDLALLISWDEKQQHSC